MGHKIKNIPENSHTHIIKKEIPQFLPHLSQNYCDHPFVSIMVLSSRCGAPPPKA
jgi:hypothetical protein